MSRTKYSYEYVKNSFEKINYKLLSTEYINSKQKLSYICNNDHTGCITFTKFKSGQRCRACYGTQLLSIEYIKNEFAKKDYILLDNEYKNAHTKLNLICPNNHNIQMSWNIFKRGSNCRICANKKIALKNSLTHEYVYNKFKERGFELMDTEYINNTIPMKYKCSCGNISKINYSNFLKGQHCYNCRNKKLSGENNSRWNSDRKKYLRLNFLKFRKSKIHILNDDVNYNDYLYNSNEFHVDHIFPRVAFIEYNLDLMYDKNIIKEICNSRDNLRIIYKQDNLKKHSKYNQKEFLNWFNEKIKEYV